MPVSPGDRRGRMGYNIRKRADVHAGKKNTTEESI